MPGGTRRRIACAAALLGAAVVVSVPARFARAYASDPATDDNGFDDPKLAREAHSFVRPGEAAGPLGVPSPAAASPAVKDTQKEPSAEAAGVASEEAKTTTAPTAAPAADVTASAPETPSPARPSSGSAWPYAPAIKLGYRRFPFAKIPATVATTPAPPTTMISESFDSVSLDIYPMSGILRAGMSTQFGWESDKPDRTGDYFIAESATLGVQLPGRFTPFLEGFAGAGYMRRMRVTGSLPTGYWQTGIDAGVEIYLAKRTYVSVAVGYLHPGNLFVMDQALMSVKTDTWSLKLGFGI